MRHSIEFLTAASGKRITVLVIGAALAGLTACSKTQAPPPPPPAPVTVGTVVEKDMPLEVRAIGNVQAYSTVNVKSQIDGQIQQVNFKEGQFVKKGDLLFVIDRRPYEAALNQAEANLARDTALEQQNKANLARDLAQANYARVERDRYKGLVKDGVVTKETFEGKDATATSLDATVKSDEAAVANAQAAINADKAAIQTAKVQLSYCTINSPIDGKLGQLLIHQGNLVKANDTVSMVVINQVIPVYVVFSVPQQELPQIKKYSDEGQLKTAAILPDGERREGSLSFLDNTVDQSTGTIQLKGIFQNQDKVLWPGQFVNVVLTLTQQPNVVVAPSQAVQSGQKGQFVYVVKPDMTVEERPVVLGQGTSTEAVVQEGLKPGEIVVTNGQLRLSKGAKVEITGSSDSPISSDNRVSRGENGK